MSLYLLPYPSHQSLLFTIAAKLSSSLVSMTNKEIVPYGFDLKNKPDALVLSIIPLEITPILSSQSYFAQAIHHLVIAPPSRCPLLEVKPR